MTAKYELYKVIQASWKILTHTRVFAFIKPRATLRFAPIHSFFSSSICCAVTNSVKSTENIIKDPSLLDGLTLLGHHFLSFLNTMNFKHFHSTFYKRFWWHFYFIKFVMCFCKVYRETYGKNCQKKTHTQKMQHFGKRPQTPQNSMKMAIAKMLCIDFRIASGSSVFDKQIYLEKPIKTLLKCFVWIQP